MYTLDWAYVCSSRESKLRVTKSEIKKKKKIDEEGKPGVGGGGFGNNIRLCLINFSAKPKRLCVLITLREVICPCWILSIGSSSILART